MLNKYMINDKVFSTVGLKIHTHKYEDGDSLPVGMYYESLMSCAACVVTKMFDKAPSVLC